MYYWLTKESFDQDDLPWYCFQWHVLRQVKSQGNKKFLQEVPDCKKTFKYVCQWPNLNSLDHIQWVWTPMPFACTTEPTIPVKLSKRCARNLEFSILTTTKAMDLQNHNWRLATRSSKRLKIVKMRSKQLWCHTITTPISGSLPLPSDQQKTKIHSSRPSVYPPGTFQRTYEREIPEVKGGSSHHVQPNCWTVSAEATRWSTFLELTFTEASWCNNLDTSNAVRKSSY